MTEIVEDKGKCFECLKEFEYRLIHNGFNDSAYSYCDRCGLVAILSGWYESIPQDAHLNLHENISKEAEPFLRSCECGGRFVHGASPRCPHCHTEISAVDATKYIEKNAPGSKQGWQWQRNWTGLYCVTIENLYVKDVWK